MIVFHKIYAKNFRSIGDDGLELILDNKKHTLFVGDNGAGKSTLTLHALTYNLFNKAYGDKDKLSSLVNSSTKKNCLTVCEFSVNGKRYRVSRGMKPSIFDIEFKTGDKWERIIDEAQTGKYQDVLLDIIGVDMTIIHNNIIMGLDKFKSFMGLTAGDRRNVVEQYLDLTIFSLMNESAKEKLKLVNDSLDNLQRKMELLNGDKINQEKVIETLEVVEKDKLKELNDSKIELKKRVDDIKKIIIEKEKDVDLKEKDVEQYNNIENEIFSLKSDLEKISLYNEDIHNLSDENKHILKKIESTSLRIKEYEKNIAEINKKLINFENPDNDYRKAQNLSSQFLSKIIDIKKEIDDINSIDVCPTCKQKMDENHRSNFLNEKNEKIDEFTKNHEKLKKLVEEKRELVEKYNCLKDEKQDIIIKLTGLKSGLKISNENHKSNIEKIKSMKDFIEKMDEKQIKSDIEEKNKLVEIKNNLVDEVNIIKRDLHGVNVQSKEFLDQIDTITTKIDEINLKPNENIQDEKDMLNDIIKTIESLENKTNSLEKHHNVIEISLKTLKDDGIKADIIKKYIPKFNEYVNYYLEKMDLWLSFEMNEKFTVKFNSPDRKGQTSASLSNGQKRRLDLAVMLGWMKISSLKNTVESNLLIIDEILDAISTDGVAEIIDMFKSEYSEKDLFITTQRANDFQELFDYGVFFQLQADGTTKMDFVE